MNSSLTLTSSGILSRNLAEIQIVDLLLANVARNEVIHVTAEQRGVQILTWYVVRSDRMELLP